MKINKSKLRRLRRSGDTNKLNAYVCRVSERNAASQRSSLEKAGDMFADCILQAAQSDGFMRRFMEAANRQPGDGHVYLPVYREGDKIPNKRKATKVQCGKRGGSQRKWPKSILRMWDKQNELEYINDQHI